MGTCVRGWWFALVAHSMTLGWQRARGSWQESPSGVAIRSLEFRGIIDKFDVPLLQLLCWLGVSLLMEFSHLLAVLRSILMVLRRTMDDMVGLALSLMQHLTVSWQAGLHCLICWYPGLRWETLESAWYMRWIKWSWKETLGLWFFNCHQDLSSLMITIHC